MWDYVHWKEMKKFKIFLLYKILQLYFTLCPTMDWKKTQIINRPFFYILNKSIVPTEIKIYYMMLDYWWLRVRFLMVYLEIFHSHYPASNWASNRNEYKRSFLRRKSDHLHVPTVLKSRSLKILEFSRPELACNGIAFPFYYKQRDDFNLCITYCFLFASYINIWRYTWHP